MKSTAIVCAIAAVSLGFSSLTFAQNDRRGSREELPRHAQQQKRDHNRVERRDERRDDRFERREDRRNDRRYDRRYDYRGPVYYYDARGPEFRRGAHMPRAYRSHQYYISNYRAYHLAPPPRGHVWVQVGGDYVLMAIATGIIASIILSH